MKNRLKLTFVYFDRIKRWQMLRYVKQITLKRRLFTVCDFLKQKSFNVC